MDGEFTWIHSDHLHSATILTDADGTELRRLAYRAFGEEAENTGSGTDPKYAYTGKERDSSGLMYYGARYYDPALSRFITADTVYDRGPQGLNRYSYALNNPIIYNDPTGHFVNGADDEVDPNAEGCITNLDNQRGYYHGNNGGGYVGDSSEFHLSSEFNPEDHETYRELNWVYDIFGKTREQVNNSARVFGVPAQVVATTIEMENAPGFKNSTKRLAKQVITFYGNMGEMLIWGEHRRDNGMGFSEGLANVKPSHAAELKRYYSKNYLGTFMSWKVNWSSEHLTSDDASISLAAAGMRRSLEEMSAYHGPDYNSYRIEELAEAAARHNTPFAPNNWRTNENWSRPAKRQDFEDDVNYAETLLQQDEDKIRNLTFMH